MSLLDEATFYPRHAARDDDAPHEIPELCDRDGALRLKAKIEAYWALRGHLVKINLCSVGFHPVIRAARVDVRSDMKNGLPKNWRPHA